jgi:transcriptional regulator with XRE-family HTH domain
MAREEEERVTGRWLVELREAAGRSQLQQARRLSDLAGRSLTRDEVARWEQGGRLPGPYWQTYLAASFGVQVAELRRMVDGDRARARASQRSTCKPPAAAPPAPAAQPGDEESWDAATLDRLADLAEPEDHVERRTALFGAVFSAASLALPPADWWGRTRARAESARPERPRRVGVLDVEAVQDATALFSRLDQRRGGGHARAGAAAYLSHDVAALLRGTFPDAATRRAMHSATASLVYVVGWSGFDDGDHVYAWRAYRRAVAFAAAGDDAPLAGHILRAMAHQAIYLGHPHAAVRLADASMEGERASRAVPRERALLGVVRARALAAAGYKRQAAAALLRAEDDLAAAEPGQREPGRVAFFAEASLWHEAAFALRDCGDLAGAEQAMDRSAQLRDRSAYARTHAVTLAYLGEIQLRRGALDQACDTWNRALDTMDGIASGRARDAVTDMRARLASHRTGKLSAVRDLNRRAAAYLTSAV